MSQIPRRRSQFEIPRSLLQKAIRRGKPEIAIKCCKYLYENDNYKWLYSRFIIILAEECWHYIGELEDNFTFENMIEKIQSSSLIIKDKGAAGLGSLAYYHFIEDERLPSEIKSNYHIRLISEALKRPKSFWRWIEGEVINEKQKRIITICERVFNMGGWPWDMSFLISAAYLSIIADIPHPEMSTVDLELPLWVAVDKHTLIGKNALRRASFIHKVDYEKISLISFYFESAITNGFSPSYWWEEEVSINLKAIGYTRNEAEELWSLVRQTVKAEIERELSGDFETIFQNTSSQKRLI